MTEIFREYGLSEAGLKPVVNALSVNRKNWVDFMMRFELGLAAVVAFGLARFIG
ncbi:MAG: VIT1/CCC1 transporter family protein [Anaerolineales bacterium]